jgi:hypothetical protein
VSQNIVYFLGGMTKNVNFPQDFLVPSESYWFMTSNIEGMKTI